MAITLEIRLARAAASTIAYMTYGDPATICAVQPMAQNVEFAWESPRIRALFERYATFSRQIAFDKRGTGMSDRRLDIPHLDERVDELRADLTPCHCRPNSIPGTSSRCSPSTASTSSARQ